MRRAAFLDRDGVINLDHGYVSKQDEFVFVPGVLEACRSLKQLGFDLIVVTNQSGIGRGMYSEQDFHELTRWMRAQFAAANAAVTAVYFCPHHPTDAIGTYRVQCTCRKPQPGLLRMAAHEWSIDLSRSVLFGDKSSDLQAAHAAAVPLRVLLNTDGAETARPPVDVALASAHYVSLRHALSSADLQRQLRDLVND